MVADLIHAYGAIKSTVQMIAGSKLPDKMAFEVGVDVMPQPDYVAIAQACGAYGRMVGDPDDVIPALKEDLAQVRKGKLAVLDARFEKG